MGGRSGPADGNRLKDTMDYTIEGIVGVAEKEAIALFAELLDHSTQRQYQYRHKWRPGDLVI